MRIFLCALCLLSVLACSTPAYYQETFSLQNGVWKNDDPARYSFSIDDPDRKFDLFLDVKHSVEYPFENLYVKIKTSFPDQTTVNDTLSIQMIDEQGQWIGKCSSNACNLKVFLQEQVKFKTAGKYGIEIEQFTRKEHLDGIEHLIFSLH